MAQRVGSPVPSTWKDFAERQGWVAAAIGDGPRQERDAAFEQIVTAIENLVATGVGEASADAGIQADLEDDHRWRFVSDLKLAWDPGLPVWHPLVATQAERFDTSDPLGDKRIPLSLDSRLSLRALIAELRQLWPKLLDRELVRRTRLLGDRTLGLLHFVCLKAPIDASSRERSNAWNEAHPEWRYTDVRAFTTAFHRGEEQLTGRKRGLAAFYDPVDWAFEQPWGIFTDLVNAGEPTARKAWEQRVLDGFGVIHAPPALGPMESLGQMKLRSRMPESVRAFLSRDSSETPAAQSSERGGSSPA